MGGGAPPVPGRRRRAEAARCSFWLAFGLMMRGHMAQANGWLRRTQTIVEDGAVDCTAAGYLLIPAVLGELGAGNPSSARDMAVEAFSIGARLGDPDLRAFGTLGHGALLIALVIKTFLLQASGAPRRRAERYSLPIRGHGLWRLIRGDDLEQALVAERTADELGADGQTVERGPYGKCDSW